MQKEKEGILLESGTNEIEIMKFTVLGEFYGINVAKVREIIMSEKVKPMPHAHPAVEGIFKPRESLITVINLAYYLSGTRPENGARDLFIVTNFNKMTVAFRVQGIEGISRISWKDIQKPDKTIANGDESVATGIAQCEGQLVTILDFEKIVAEIAPETSIQVSEIEAMGDRPLCESPILIAEDSILLRRMIDDSLERAGFTNIMNFNNGQEAWDYLLSIRDDSDLYEKVNLVITDIEMPEMDGHRLTKLIKDDPRLKKLPVVIFSSLIDEQMRRKGRELGADEQLAKPEIGHLVSILDELLKKYAQDMGKFQGQKNAQEEKDMRYEMTKDLETGNALIDSEHRQLFKAVNDLLDACSQGKGRSQVESTLDFLVSYVAKHFGDEEKLQVQTSYPGYAAHRQFHEWYKGELAGAARDIKTQGASITALNSLNQMVGKLLMHIRTDDRKVAQHVRQS